MAQPEKSQPQSGKASLIFVLKVFGLSTILSIVIKVLGPLLPIAASNQLALGVVLTPSLVLGLLLLLRGQRQSG